MKFNLNLTLLICAGAALAFLILYYSCEPWSVSRSIGAIVAFPALVLLVAARLQLGSAFTVRARATVLVTQGIYSRIRNPIYIFSCLAIAGLAFFFDQPYLLWLLLVLVPLQVYRAKKEEQVLHLKFGDEYLRYKQRTWF